MTSRPTQWKCTCIRTWYHNHRCASQPKRIESIFALNIELGMSDDKKRNSKTLQCTVVKLALLHYPQWLPSTRQLNKKRSFSHKTIISNFVLKQIWLSASGILHPDKLAVSVVSYLTIREVANNCDVHSQSFKQFYSWGTAAPFQPLLPFKHYLARCLVTKKLFTGIIYYNWEIVFESVF